jgi:hypothetical protein
MELKAAGSYDHINELQGSIREEFFGDLSDTISSQQRTSKSLIMKFSK